MKREWNQPELTVLVRTRPEEAVLGVCKNGEGAGSPGLNNYDSRCLQNEALGSCINVCQTELSS